MLLISETHPQSINYFGTQVSFNLTIFGRWQLWVEIKFSPQIEYENIYGMQYSQYKGQN